MPCDSIAFIKAKVNLDLPETLAAILDVDAVATVLLAHLKEKFGQAQIFARTEYGVSVEAGSMIVSYQAGEGVGASKESTRWDARQAQADVDALTQEVKTILRQAAAMLLQAKVQDTLSQVGTIKSVMDYNGTVVYKVAV